MVDRDEMIERGRKKLADLRERYRPDYLASGELQLRLLPEELAILLAIENAGKEFNHLIPKAPQPETVIHITPQQLERIIGHNVGNAPPRTVKQPANKPADV